MFMMDLSFDDWVDWRLLGDTAHPHWTVSGTHLSSIATIACKLQFKNVGPLGGCLCKDQEGIRKEREPAITIH